MLFCLWFILGVLYVSWSKTKTEGFNPPIDRSFNLDPAPDDFNDSISINQIKRMDSLHKAGKL